MFKDRRTGGLAALVALAIVAGGSGAMADQPERGGMPSRDCFNSRDWNGWKSPSADVLYIKVRQRDVYRIDLVGGGPRLSGPGTYLVSITRGSGRICAPIDLDLRAADGVGPAFTLFPKTITKLSAAQVKALPREARP